MESTGNHFSEAMRQKSDGQLLQILRTRYEHPAEAVSAAEEELQLRDIDPALLLPEEADARSQRGFAWYHKAGMLLLPFVIMFLFNRISNLVPSDKGIQLLGLPFLVLSYYLIGRYLKTNGYGRMAADFRAWTNYTLYIFIGILLLGILALLVMHVIY